MSISGGNIIVELSLDDQNFSINVKNAGQVLRQLQGTLNQTASSVKALEEAHSSLGNRFHMMVQTLGQLRFAAMDVHDVFLRLPAAIAKTAGEMERTQALLAGLSKEVTKAGKAAEAASNFDYITKMAMRAPFEISALSDSFVKLKSAGIDPTAGSLQALVDGVAKFGGNSETMKRATIAIQQMMGKGVVSMEELRQQLGEAVPTAMKAMADGMGLTMNELTQKVSKGTVQAADAVNKMLVMMQFDSQDAARDMMQTWTGMLAQLKTRYDLAAVEISKAGFGQALKDVGADLGKSLDSVEFKRFLDSFGQGLGNAVRDLADGVKAALKYADAIKLVAEAYVAWKAASFITLPSEQLFNNSRKVVAAFADERAAAAANAMATRALDIEMATSAQERAARAAAQAQQNALRRAEELERIRQNNALVIAAEQAKQAELAMLERRAFIPGLNNSSQRDALKRQIDELAMANSNLVARQRAATIASTEAAEADRIATAVLAQKTAAMGELSFMTARTAGTLGTLKAAMSALGTAFTAMGGWMTVLNLAIMAGTYAWFNWGKAAEEAVARSERARKQIANQKDLDQITADLKTVQEKKAQADQILKTMVDHGWGLPTAGEAQRKSFEDALSNQARYAKQLTQLQKDAVNAGLSIDKENARSASQEALQIVQDKIQDIHLRYAQEANALKEVADQKIKDAKGNQKLESQIAEQYSKDKKALIGRQQAEERALLQKNIDEQGKLLGGKGSSAAAALATQTALEDQLKGLNSQGAMLKQAMDPNKFVSKNNDKPEKKSPIEELIERLHAQHVELETEVAGIAAGASQLDKAQAAYKKVMDKYHGGGFDYPDKDAAGKPIKRHATQAQAEAAAQLAKKNEQDHELIKDYESLTNLATDLGPRYADALQVLMDPLGSSKNGSAVSKVEKVYAELERSPARMKAVMDTMGKAAYDAMHSKDMNEAMTIDASAPFQKMVEETKTLNDSLVSDSREAAKARSIADNERHRQMMQNIIDEDRAHGMSKDLTDKMQAELNANVAARAATTAEKFKSPLEKMAQEWENSTRAMQDATVRWADSGADALANFVTTGKLDFKSLANSIIADLVRIQIKKAASGWVGAATNALGSYFGTGSTAAASSTAAAFADGGIMTKFGPAPLRKYANGGIANSPQVALYGEGDTNEAYVPLPDGRRIPVALQGSGGAGGAPAVTVNVINQSGQAVNAKQGQPRFDGKQMVLDVVLSAASTPGPFRDGMKGALN